MSRLANMVWKTVALIAITTRCCYILLRRCFSQALRASLSRRGVVRR